MAEEAGKVEAVGSCDGRGHEAVKKRVVHSVAFHKLLGFADLLDWLLMAAGRAGAVVHGAAMPVFFLLLGELVNGFGKNQHNLRSRLKSCMSDISMDNSLFFTYEELYQITDGFSAQRLLGEGGFGSVYKGRLPDGKEVAVKQLNDGGGQGEREFHAEMEIISHAHHRHLASLVGYCISNNQRLLAYDFVPNNTLHHHLHGHGRPVFDWLARVKITARAARGVAYLHEHCHPSIIHRDIKSSNILLDNSFEAQVGDFGLVRLALDAITHVTTRVMWTFWLSEVHGSRVCIKWQIDLEI